LGDVFSRFQVAISWENVGKKHRWWSVFLIPTRWSALTCLKVWMGMSRKT
jgi:hypothetical protein